MTSFHILFSYIFILRLSSTALEITKIDPFSILSLQKTYLYDEQSKTRVKI